jgi:3-oxoacyl-[acyl-carrier-protein] synthase III
MVRKELTRVIEKKMPKLSNEISECDKEQAIINMPTVPQCYLKALKENNYSYDEARIFISHYLEINTVELDKLLKENKFWGNAFSTYYQP